MERSGKAEIEDWCRGRVFCGHLTMAIAVETIPSSTRTYSGVINSVLIQTEDGRQYDSSIQYNRIRDHSTDYYHHFQSERPRLFAKPVVLLGLAIFVAVWLFSESNRFAVFPLTASSHKFGKAKVANMDNGGNGTDSFYELEKTYELDPLNGDDDQQFDDELAIVEDHKSKDTSTDDDDDDVLGEDDNFGDDKSKTQSKEEKDKLWASNLTNSSNATTATETRVNATKYNL
mmetsp:Transcript_22088/g.36093  ORF Transcript_22088/g.36093 Transcript_22088/m.36093 type:complete len:231 (-) Transcript_22088:857-1549(-)|eukprot:scaffold1352_cov136-Skeletonema_menzelii.AAC.13